MISGALNENLLPTIPVGFKKLAGEWQEFKILLDTGSEYDLMIAESAVRQYRIGLRPYCNSPVLMDPLQLPSKAVLTSPFWVDMMLDGNPKIVKAEFLETDVFPGAIGPSLLLNRRITVDAVRNGAVRIDWIPVPMSLDRIQSLVRKPEWQEPSPDYRWQLPWVDVAIKDNRGRWQRFSANVDTGDSSQLSLPPSKVEQFNLMLADRCWVNTPNGPLLASCGEVEMFWQGSMCTVECIQRLEENPPLIGMKLLRGNRITIDLNVDHLTPAVRIARIPRLASSIRNSLQSSKRRLLRSLRRRL